MLSRNKVVFHHSIVWSNDRKTLTPHSFESRKLSLTRKLSWFSISFVSESHFNWFSQLWYIVKAHLFILSSALPMFFHMSTGKFFYPEKFSTAELNILSCLDSKDNVLYMKYHQGTVKLCWKMITKQMLTSTLIFSQPFHKNTDTRAYLGKRCLNRAIFFSLDILYFVVGGFFLHLKKCELYFSTWCVTRQVRFIELVSNLLQ